MIAARVASVHLLDTAKDVLTVTEYERVSEWLTHWTAPANFKAVLAEDANAARVKLNKAIFETLLPPWLRLGNVKPTMFGFYMATTEVVDGEFWSVFSVIQGGKTL